MIPCAGINDGEVWLPGCGIRYKAAREGEVIIDGRDNYSGSSNFYIADNVFLGRNDRAI